MKKNSTSSQQKHKQLFIISSILILLDIITKELFTNKYYFQSLPINITYSENIGSSFGLFANIPNYNQILILASFLLIYILFKNKNYFLNVKKYSNINLTIFILLISGIISNLLNRLIFGYVKDIFLIKNFFIFNLADLYLNLAFILFIYLEFKTTTHLKKQNKNSKQSHKKQKFKKGKNKK